MLNEQSLHRAIVNTVAAGIETMNTQFCETFQLLILSNVRTWKDCENILRADTVNALRNLRMLTLSSGVSNMVV